MGFFDRRRRPDNATPTTDTDQLIAAFWSWWLDDARARATEAFDARDVERINALGEETAAQVVAMHPKLAFEFGPGDSARHRLMVTAAGNPEGRAVAERWLAAAPPADDAFQYDSWKQPQSDPAGVVIGFADTRVDLASAVVLTAPQGDRTEVLVHHPAFAELPEQVQGELTFMFLDMTLGEQVVETRIGGVSWAAQAPAGAFPLTDLPGVLAR